MADGKMEMARGMSSIFLPAILLLMARSAEALAYRRAVLLLMTRSADASDCSRAALLLFRLLSRIVVRVDVVDYERPDGMHLNHSLAFCHGVMPRPFGHSDE